MIDWISAIFPVPCKVAGGKIITLSPDGEILFEKNSPYIFQGSYDSKISVCNIIAEKSLRGKGLEVGLHDTFLYVSGNPAKYLQGHNIYGSNDLQALMCKWVQSIVKLLPIDDNWRQVLCYKAFSGDYQITRIDVTENFRVGTTNDDVHKWLHNANKTARMSHKNASPMKGDTFYFGQHSRRHTVKLYNKYSEIERHGVDPKLIDYHDKMKRDIEGCIRIECCYRSKKLEDMGFSSGRQIMYYANKNAKRVSEVIQDMLKEDIKKIQLSAQVDNNQITVKTVGAAAYGVYCSWSDGNDVRTDMAKATFYRHRNKLLPYGVDLLLPPIAEKKKVVNLQRFVLTDIPMLTAPEWYRLEGLLAA